jgi:hypothetical protein
VSDLSTQLFGFVLSFLPLVVALLRGHPGRLNIFVMCLVSTGLGEIATGVADRPFAMTSIDPRQIIGFELMFVGTAVFLWVLALIASCGRGHLRGKAG